MYGHTYSKNRNQPGKVAHPARGQLNRKNNVSLSPFTPENLVSRGGFGSPILRQPAHLHTQAESGAYLRDFSRVPRRRPFASFRLTSRSTPQCPPAAALVPRHLIVDGQHDIQLILHRYQACLGSIFRPALFSTRTSFQNTRA